MLFPLTTLCLVACLAGVYRHDGRRSAMGLGLCAWAVTLLLASPLIFSYAVGYSLRVDAFVAACLSGATATYLLCRRARRAVPSTYFNREQEIRIAKLLGVAGILGCLLLLADASLNGGLQFSVSYLVKNLSAVRDDQFAGLDSGANRGVVGTIGGLLAPCAVLSVLAAIRLGGEAGRNLRWFGIVNFALVASVSLMVFAGRATIVNLTLLILVSLFVSGRRLSLLRPRTLVVVTLLLIGAWYLSTSFLGLREDKPNAVRVLARTQRAEMRPWLARTAQRDETLGLMMVSVGYFASPLPTLTFYTQQPPLPGPYYGAYSYPLPARVVGTINGTWTRNERADLRTKVFTPIEAAGYFGNVWATWLRDLLVDFGYFGAIVFCGLFGAFLGWVRNHYELTGALHYHYLEVVACFTFGFGAFAGFMFDPFLAFPFFIALAVMVIVRGSRFPALGGRAAASSA